MNRFFHNVWELFVRTIVCCFFLGMLCNCSGFNKDYFVAYDKRIQVADPNDMSFFIYPFEIGDTLIVVVPACWDEGHLCVRGMEVISSSNKFQHRNDGRWDTVSVCCNRYYDIRMQNLSKKIVFYKSEQNGIFIKTDKESMMDVDNSVDKSITAKGRLKCFTKEGEIEYDGKLSKIKGRGNWTWSHSQKKPYSIKLKSTSSLLGLSSHRSFNLLSNPFDASHIRNWIALNIAEDVGLPYSIHCNFCALWADGEYKGLYLLTEKIHIGKGNIDITDMDGGGIPADNTGGYVLEQDIYSSDETSFQSKNGLFISLKEPRKIADEDLFYIKQRYEDMYFSIISKDGINPRTHKHWSEYIDKKSFALYYLLQELFYNYDAGYSSVFMFKDKDDIDSLFYAGPLWDMDNTMSPWWGQREDMQYKAYILKAGIIPSPNGDLFSGLCAHVDFYQEVKDAYNKNVSKIFHQYFNYEKMDSIYTNIKTDIYLNNLLWYGKKDNGFGAFTELYKFMNQRIDFFDDDMNSEDTYTVIVDVNQNYPIRHHLMEWHLREGECFSLVKADAPGYLLDGFFDSNGEEYNTDTIHIHRDLRLIYRYKEESFIDQLKRFLVKRF